MKKLAVIALTLSIACASISVAAQGRQPKAGDGVTIQNSKAIAPVPAASRCDSSTGTKGVLKSYSTSGYTQICYKAVNSTTGADVVVKRKLNSNTAFMPGPGDCITNDKPLSGSWTIQKIVLDRYSAASNGVTTCVERQ